jgi:hypothetical protein
VLGRGWEKEERLSVSNIRPDAFSCQDAVSRWRPADAISTTNCQRRTLPLTSIRLRSTTEPRLVGVLKLSGAGKVEWEDPVATAQGSVVERHCRVEWQDPVATPTSRGSEVERRW